jgi:hypothetical protein
MAFKRNASLFCGPLFLNLPVRPKNKNKNKNKNKTLPSMAFRPFQGLDGVK